MGSFPFRLLLVLATTVAVWILSSTPVAFGAADTEAQNSELTVSLTMPDQAKVGDTVQATISITNNTRRIENISVEGAWTDPDGQATVTSRNGLLLPGQTVTRVVDYVINESCVPGTHAVTIKVQNRNGASTATANVEVV
jgi:uncharacterized protein YfaS (alpha-2-macroglobulin family)